MAKSERKNIKIIKKTKYISSNLHIYLAIPNFQTRRLQKSTKQVQRPTIECFSKRATREHNEFKSNERK